MRVRERRLKFERFEQRKVFAAESVSDLLPPASLDDYSSPVAMEADGVRAAEVRIQFDPLTVRPDMSSLKAGDAWNGKASVVANVDEVAGTLVAFVFATRPITGQGNLLELEFKSASTDLISHDTASIGIDTVRLNEGQIEIPYELSVMSAPDRSGIEQEPGIDAASPETLPMDGVEVSGSDSGEEMLSEEMPSEEMPGEDSSKVTRDEMFEPERDRREFARHYLHDMQITSVFIGPVRPDFDE